MKFNFLFLLIASLFVAVLSATVSFSFESQNSNYKIIGTIGLGEISEKQNADYKTNAIMPNQPTGKFESANYKIFIGPHYEIFNLSEDEILFFDLNLVSGWNLISLPLIPQNSSISNIMNTCSYNKIWSYDNENKNWKSTDSGLTDMNVYSGYWIDRNGQMGNCIIQLRGTLSSSTVINVSNGWNLVGYTSLNSKNISDVINNSLYNKIWFFNQTNGWKSTDSGLNTFEPGKGYYVDAKENGFFSIINS